mgnify:CR=1 FL=1
MANTYTINTPSILQSGRTLDDPGAFPPASAYRTVFTPKPGEISLEKLHLNLVYLELLTATLNGRQDFN